MREKLRNEIKEIRAKGFNIDYKKFDKCYTKLCREMNVNMVNNKVRFYTTTNQNIKELKQIKEICLIALDCVM